MLKKTNRVTATTTKKQENIQCFDFNVYWLVSSSLTDKGIAKYSLTLT